jgi:Na+-driven multidrug efflux pump
MGVAGAALATAISQAAAAVWVMAYYFSKNPALRLRLANLRPRPHCLGEICSIGLSPFLMQAAASLVQVVVNYSLAYYGRLELGDESAAIAAMVIINSVALFITMPVFGVNQGVQPIIGFNHGRKDYKRVKEALRWSVIYCVILCGLGFAGVLLFAPALVRLFGGESEELIQIGARGMRIFLMTLPLLGFLSPGLNFIQSIGRAKMSIFLNLLRQVLLLIPAFILLPRFFGLDGIWVAAPAADLLCFAVAVWVVVREVRRLGA